MTEIRWAPLPTDVIVQTWEEDGRTIVVVNDTLPPARQRAALREALREVRTRRGSLVLLPVGLVLAVKQLKRAVHAHPLAAPGVVSVAAATTVVTVLNSPPSVEQPDESGAAQHGDAAPWPDARTAHHARSGSDNHEGGAAGESAHDPHGGHRAGLCHPSAGR